MSIRNQIRGISLLLSPALVLLAVVAFISIHFDVDVSRMTRDPLAITESHPLLGFVSNLGAILWSAAASVCLFTAALPGRRDVPGNMRAFILAGGLLTLMLLFDDLFMLHEHVYTRLLGIREKFVFAIYGGLTLAYLAAFRMRIMQSGAVLYLAAALGLFAVSLFVDRLPDTVPPMHHLYEDGSKFLGIVSWLGFHVAVCRRYLAAPRLDRT